MKMNLYSDSYTGQIDISDVDLQLSPFTYCLHSFLFCFCFCQRIKENPLYSLPLKADSCFNDPLLSKQNDLDLP